MSKRIKLTPLQERYVQARLEGMKPSAAYRAAGGTVQDAHQITIVAQRIEKATLVQERLNAATKEAFERNVGSVEYIINECVEIVREAREGGPKTLGAAVAALNLLAKRFPEFREPLVDARQVNLQIPEGTSIEDIKALRQSLLDEDS
jgi:hypothetical protein